MGLEDTHWFIDGLDSPTSRPVIPLNLPEKIKVDFLPSDQTLEGMLEAGQFDALFALALRRCQNGSYAALHDVMRYTDATTLEVPAMREI